MKWETPKIGDVREYKRFSWLPMSIEHEFRWLETVKTKQEYKRIDFIDYTRDVWVDIEFLN